LLLGEKVNFKYTELVLDNAYQEQNVRFIFSFTDKTFKVFSI
jgi:hypothetical protein